MKKECLTAYDRFLMNKSTAALAAEDDDLFYGAEEEHPNKVSSEYAKYLQMQLRRTEPSNEKVLTEAEYFNSEFATKNKKKKSAILKSHDEQNAEGAKKRSVQFKKSGKLLLIGYVIIMLSLALIVIVKTTIGDNLINADAANVQDEDTAQKIITMQDEDAEENDNWFDNFCDSLK